MVSKTGEPGGNEAARIPVQREELRIGTRVVDTGRGVRVRKTVTEQPHEVDQALRHDEVSVTRVDVGRLLPPGELPATRYEGDTLVVPVLEEVLVLERRLRIKEEIRITKTRREERHTDTVSLKTEQVTVERFDDASDP